MLKDNRCSLVCIKRKHILFIVFNGILGRKHKRESWAKWNLHLRICLLRRFQSSEEPLLHCLICSFVMMGHRLVNFNFWFQKLSNTAQMRNQFSQLPSLCGEKNSLHWWTAHHMTESGISSVGPCCHHLNYRLPLVIYLYNISFSDTTHI